MAEIPVASPTRAILASDKHAKDRKYKRDSDDDDDNNQDQPQPDPTVTEGDVFTVMDLPADEITPRVQETLNQIMGQVDRLRDELGHARSHIVYLEELSETHTFLPVINRRGLHREMSRLLALGERAGVVISFVCFHVCNMEGIRRKFGHAAAEAGLTWVAECLNDCIRDTDVAGSMGGHDFGLILTLADNETAAEKAAEIAALLESGSFPWDGERLSLKTAYGLHTFRPGDSAESAMRRADDDLLKRQSDTPA